MSTLRKYKIVVVEDNILVMLVAHDILAIAGFEVLEAYSADGAIELLEAHPEVRLVFTDIQLLGERNGLSLALEIGDRWPQIGVILTSGDTGPSCTSGVPHCQFLPKPWQPGQLLRAATDFLVAHPAHRPYEEPAAPMAQG